MFKLSSTDRKSRRLQPEIPPWRWCNIIYGVLIGHFVYSIWTINYNVSVYYTPAYSGMLEMIIIIIIILVWGVCVLALYFAPIPVLLKVLIEFEKKGFITSKTDFIERQIMAFLLLPVIVILFLLIYLPFIIASIVVNNIIFP